MSASVSPSVASAAMRLVEDEKCPWCDQLIPHEKFDEIHARIAAKERQRTVEADARLKAQLAQERGQLEAKARADVELIRRQNAEAIQQVRAEAMNAAQAAMAEKLAQSEAGKVAADEKLKLLQNTHQAELNTRLQEQRASLEKAQTAAVSTEKANAFKERQKLEGKLQELQRALQKKTAEELGEGAEVDLFEALKAEFEGDRIKRVAKGSAGADIIHEVVHNGAVCGTIVYDSKNRNAWRNDYVTKLRQDQLAAKADHAILASAVFPSGAKQLHIQEGVIIANPARVVVLGEMLRKQVVQTHTLRLSNQAREQKTEQLYAFITSDRCAQLFERADSLVDDLLALEVKEVSAHEATWKKRGELLRSAQKVTGDLTAEIDRIVCAKDGG